jgi:hypothetical protein
LRSLAAIDPSESRAEPKPSTRLAGADEVEDGDGDDRQEIAAQVVRSGTRMPVALISTLPGWVFRIGSASGIRLGPDAGEAAEQRGRDAGIPRSGS